MEDAEVKYNPLGFWVRRDGRIFEDKDQITEIKFNQDDSGYKYFEKDGKKIFAHRIVVFTYGDCDGREYQAKGHRSIVDHINMKHWDNRIENLQLVSNGINLFRAYYRSGNPNAEERFKSYYISLDDIDRKILDFEIQADIEGRY